jgi:hypothetical protein
VATERFLLGVCPELRQWFILRNGKLFRYAHKAGASGTDGPAYPPSDPTPLPEGARALWADTLAREFLDAHTGGHWHDAMKPMVARYHKLVSAYVQGAVIDLASKNVERSPKDFAFACSRDWSQKELTHGTPTIRHALWVALGLQLREDDAAALIEYAAFIELRIPAVQRETALMIYREMARMLAILCPTWLIQGAACPWKELGTCVDDLFSKQFMRMANDADARGLTIDVLTGMRLAITQVGESPLAYRYLDRAQWVEPEEAKNLEDFDMKIPELDIEDRRL